MNEEKAGAPEHVPAGEEEAAEPEEEWEEDAVPEEEGEAAADLEAAREEDERSHEKN
mgnify:CR=1 FL=1